MSITPETGRIPAFTRGDRFRKARETAGYGVGELATALGVSRNTIGNIEAERVQPKRVTAIAWSVATGVPQQWLMTGEAPTPDGDGASVVRPKGFEPLTSCSAHYLGLTSTFSSAA